MDVVEAPSWLYWNHIPSIPTLRSNARPAQASWFAYLAVSPRLETMKPMKSCHSLELHAVQQVVITGEERPARLAPLLLLLCASFPKHTNASGG